MAELRKFEFLNFSVYLLDLLFIPYSIAINNGSNQNIAICMGKYGKVWHYLPYNSGVSPADLFTKQGVEGTGSTRGGDQLVGINSVVDH